MTGFDARELQRDLNASGYGPVVVDGLYGEQTAAAYAAAAQDSTLLGGGVPVPVPEPEKPWWQSRTLIGLAVVLAAQVAKLAGFEIDSQALTDAIVTGATLIGAALAWWGRVRATRPITRRR